MIRASVQPGQNFAWGHRGQCRGSGRIRQADGGRYSCRQKPYGRTKRYLWRGGRTRYLPRPSDQPEYCGTRPIAWPSFSSLGKHAESFIEICGVRLREAGAVSDTDWRRPAGRVALCPQVKVLIIVVGRTSGACRSTPAVLRICRQPFR